MGKLILCKGKRTSKAYILKGTNTRIYTIEELSYYIYNNIYVVSDKLIDINLIQWIGYSLELDDLKQALMQSLNNFKLSIEIILSYSNYYSEIQIKAALDILDDISKLSIIERRIYRANKYIAENNHNLALYEMDKIIKSKEINKISKEKFGDILHNYGVSTGIYYGFVFAKDHFKKAYENNQNESSLYNYLYCIILKEGQEKFEDEAKKYDLSIEKIDSIKDYIKELTTKNINSIPREESVKENLEKWKMKYKNWKQELNEEKKNQDNW